MFSYRIVSHGTDDMSTIGKFGMLAKFEYAIKVCYCFERLKLSYKFNIHKNHSMKNKPYSFMLTLSEIKSAILNLSHLTKN